MDGKIKVRLLLITLLSCMLALTPANAQEFEPEQPFQLAQNDGMTLSEAIESVRGRIDGRILDAQTKTSDGRDMHHIKVLTKDGKVKTYKIPGRKRGNG